MRRTYRLLLMFALTVGAVFSPFVTRVFASSNPDSPTITVDSSYSTLTQESRTYDCKSADNSACRAYGDSKIKLSSSYEYRDRTISFCNYILSVNNGLSIFIPAKTQAEYQSFLTWASNNANVLTFHAGCDNGGWGPWTGCESACGNCAQTRQCYYLNNAQYAGNPCVGDSTRVISATGGCTYTSSFVACPTACGLAASQLSPSGCLRSDGVAVDISYCSETRACAATEACSLCGNGRLDSGEYCDGLNCQSCLSCPGGYYQKIGRALIAYMVGAYSNPSLFAQYGCRQYHYGCNCAALSPGSQYMEQGNDGYCLSNITWELCGTRSGSYGYWCSYWEPSCFQCPGYLSAMCRLMR